MSKFLLSVSALFLILIQTGIANSHDEKSWPWKLTGANPELGLAQSISNASDIIICYDKGDDNSIWVGLNGNLQTKVLEGACTTIAMNNVTISMIGSPTLSKRAEGRFFVISK